MSTEHSSRQHALLSASGSARWLNCPPSARMEEKFPSKDSVYAAEGTLAHEFAELTLRLKTHTGPLPQRKPWQKAFEQFKKHDLFQEEMLDYVNVYAEYVLSEYYEACKKVPDSVLLIEEKLDYSYYVKNGFGTGDAIIISDGTLEVIDLKYGKGVVVSAENNTQEMLYGLAALHKYEILYGVDTVKLTIVQPRLDAISSWEISAEDLLKWGETTVREQAKKADRGIGVCNPGDWCRWCKAKPICKAVADHNTDLATKDFAHPNTLSDEELLEVYGKIDGLVDWAGSVKAYLLEQALEGKAWKGLKLVEGRANRKWLDENKVISALLSKKYDQNDIVNVKVKGISDIEKLVGKPNFQALLGDLVIKPQGKPTLVPESDKRPAMGNEQAKKDFAS